MFSTEVHLLRKLREEYESRLLLESNSSRASALRRQIRRTNDDILRLTMEHPEQTSKKAPPTTLTQVLIGLLIAIIGTAFGGWLLHLLIIQ